MRGYYVTAKNGTARNYVCGPFPRHTTALAMVRCVRLAALRTQDPLFTQASFGTGKIIADTLPPGSLDLKFLRMEDL